MPTSLTTMLREAGRCTTCARPRDHVHLVGVSGYVPAKPASELRKGDMVVYNFGQRGLIVDEPRRVGQMVHFKVLMVRQFGGSGKVYESKRRASTLVPTMAPRYPEKVDRDIEAELRRE